MKLISVTDGERITEQYPCSLKFDGKGAAVIDYTDSSSARCVIRLSDKRADIVRTGERGLRLKIAAQEVTRGWVKTPYGELNIDVRGGEVEWSADGGTLNARLSYNSGSEVSLTIAVTYKA